MARRSAIPLAACNRLILNFGGQHVRRPDSAFRLLVEHFFILYRLPTHVSLECIINFQRT